MELIYSVKHIFDNATQFGCLSQYNSNTFHIPAYQRGYKWASDKNGAVSVLLNDLWSAFNKTPDKEYYLQYITVKQNITKNYLELIDGQQRITTLSILLSVYSQIFNQNNIAFNKLDYAVRSSFFKDYIFKTENLNNLLISNNWNEFIANQLQDLDKQDVFYFFEAARKINTFISKETKNSLPFFEFILNQVKIIVNSVEAHIESETVFKNLNSNKVPLTEVELIKGLFITRVRTTNNSINNKSFIEITEIRARIGQQWDEITNWANTSNIATFYFNGKSGMHHFLTLVGIYLGYKSTSNKTDFPLFNFFLKQENFQQVFNQLLQIYRILNDWYLNNNLYHLLGFVRFVKNSEHNTLSYLAEILESENKATLINSLKEKRTELIAGDVRFLRYGSDDDKIHAILLYLNIFFEEHNTKQSTFRFDFHAFIKEKWTLEHIFPQSPEGKGAVLTEENKEEIYQILGGKENIDAEIISILKQDKRNDLEKDKYYKLLQATDYLNSLGNMCLLTGSDNSSNGCMFFKEKRANTLQRIQKGSFVPKHTFEVFSKMITPEMARNSIEIWNKNDIENHLTWMSNMIKTEAI